MKRKIMICLGLACCMMIAACAHSFNPKINRSRTITDNSQVTIDNSTKSTTVIKP